MVANIALPLAGRVAVNLNYTVSSEVMNACIRQCGIRHVLTSRKVMEKLNLKLDAELVYLEDFKSQRQPAGTSWSPSLQADARAGVHAGAAGWA